MERKIFSLFKEDELYYIPNPTDDNERELLEMTEDSIESIGENQKKILIIIEDKIEKSINEKNKDFLVKILQSVNLTFKDVAIVNCAHYSALNFEIYRDYFLPTKLIVFVNKFEPVMDWVGLKMYKRFQVEEMAFFLADSLSILQEDKDKKMQLWNALKELFPESF